MKGTSIDTTDISMILCLCRVYNNNIYNILYREHNIIKINYNYVKIVKWTNGT